MFEPDTSEHLDLWSTRERGGLALSDRRQAVEPRRRRARLPRQRGRPHVMSVGLGGYPDRSGEVTLDASLMRSPSQCGSVCYVRRFMHPVSIARLVMEKTPHVLLAGDGADRFAQAPGHGGDRSAHARVAGGVADVDRRARRGPARPTTPPHLPPANIEEKRPLDELAACRRRCLARYGRRVGHGRRGGVCRRMLDERLGLQSARPRGRFVRHRSRPVRRSPRRGGRGHRAGRAGHGRLRNVPGRRGHAPRRAPLDAAVEVLDRIIHSYTLREEHQVAIITLDRQGRWSSAALRPGYHTAVRTPTRDELVEPERVMLA